MGMEKRKRWSKRERKRTFGEGDRVKKKRRKKIDDNG